MCFDYLMNVVAGDDASLMRVELEMWCYLSDHLVILLVFTLIFLQRIAQAYVINAVVEKPKGKVSLHHCLSSNATDLKPCIFYEPNHSLNY